MSQIGFYFDGRVVGESFELVDLKNGYYRAKNEDGLYLTADETGSYKWEAEAAPPLNQSHQSFSLTGGFATFWPTTGKNVQIPIQVRP